MGALVPTLAFEVRVVYPLLRLLLGVMVDEPAAELLVDTNTETDGEYLSGARRSSARVKCTNDVGTVMIPAAQLDCEGIEQGQVKLRLRTAVQIASVVLALATREGLFAEDEDDAEAATNMTGAAKLENTPAAKGVRKSTKGKALGQFLDMQQEIDDTGNRKEKLNGWSGLVRLLSLWKHPTLAPSAAGGPTSSANSPKKSANPTNPSNADEQIETPVGEEEDALLVEMLLDVMKVLTALVSTSHVAFTTEKVRAYHHLKQAQKHGLVCVLQEALDWHTATAMEAGALLGARLASAGGHTRGSGTAPQDVSLQGGLLSVGGGGSAKYGDHYRKVWSRHCLALLQAVSVTSQLGPLALRQVNSHAYDKARWMRHEREKREDIQQVLSEPECLSGVKGDSATGGEFECKPAVMDASTVAYAQDSLQKIKDEMSEASRTAHEEDDFENPAALALDQEIAAGIRDGCDAAPTPMMATAVRKDSEQEAQELEAQAQKDAEVDAALEAFAAAEAKAAEEEEQEAIEKVQREKTEAEKKKEAQDLEALKLRKEQEDHEKQLKKVAETQAKVDVRVDQQQALGGAACAERCVSTLMQVLHTGVTGAGNSNSNTIDFSLALGAMQGLVPLLHTAPQTLLSAHTNILNHDMLTKAEGGSSGQERGPRWGGAAETAPLIPLLCMILRYKEAPKLLPHQQQQQSDGHGLHAQCVLQAVRLVGAVVNAAKACDQLSLAKNGLKKHQNGSKNNSSSSTSSRESKSAGEGHMLTLCQRELRLCHVSGALSKLLVLGYNTDPDHRTAGLGDLMSHNRQTQATGPQDKAAAMREHKPSETDKTNAEPNAEAKAQSDKAAPQQQVGGQLLAVIVNSLAALVKAEQEQADGEIVTVQDQDQAQALGYHCFSTLMLVAGARLGGLLLHLSLRFHIDITETKSATAGATGATATSGKRDVVMSREMKEVERQHVEELESALLALDALVHVLSVFGHEGKGQENDVDEGDDEKGKKEKKDGEDVLELGADGTYDFCTAEKAAAAATSRNRKNKNKTARMQPSGAKAKVGAKKPPYQSRGCHVDMAAVAANMLSGVDSAYNRDFAKEKMKRNSKGSSSSTDAGSSKQLKTCSHPTCGKMLLQRSFTLGHSCQHSFHPHCLAAAVGEKILGGVTPTCPLCLEGLE